MNDNTVKREHEPDFSFPTQHGTMNTNIATMSVVPQMSSRPNTLPIGTHYGNNPLLFTPNDYNKFSLSTPDLINALTSQQFTDGQPSPGAKILDEIFTTHSNNMNNYSLIQSINPYDHTDSHKIVSSTDNQKQENVPTYRADRTNSQVSSSRDRSVSSSMNDNDSSSSVDPTSPMISYQYSNGVKDESQHVPSTPMNVSGQPHELVRKERKRERNRQAAQKCRTRKLTRIAELQKRVNELQGKNKDLTGIAECLKGDITKLERQLQDHHTQGCTLMNGSIL